jgi:hypothetical protein
LRVYIRIVWLVKQQQFEALKSVYSSGQETHYNAIENICKNAVRDNLSPRANRPRRRAN